MSTWQKVVETLRLGNNLLVGLFITVVALAALYGLLTGGPWWFALVAVGGGLLAWWSVREDLDDVKLLWSARQAQAGFEEGYDESR
jgi:hypothetical protein